MSDDDWTRDQREICNDGMWRLKLKKFADNYAIDPHGDGGCASSGRDSRVFCGARETARHRFSRTFREETWEKIERKPHASLSYLDEFKFREREREKVHQNEGRVTSPEVTTELRYICGNGKSTDTPKLMDRAGCTANPTLSLLGQIEFREDCVTLPPSRGRYFHFGELSANIMPWRTAPNVRYVYCYLAVTARRK